jgi:S-adenosylmethionine hydrolase
MKKESGLKSSRLFFDLPDSVFLHALTPRFYDTIISKSSSHGRKMTVITLTTDFGEKDGFTGVLKGVIWGVYPEAQIADITHAISPQNIFEGSMAIFRAAPYFPKGTVHIAVVDPGVGTKRRPLAARLGDHYFVGPDNGLFTPLFEDAEKRNLTLEFVHLDNPEYWLPDVSHTFHGRDIFAPVGAHLAKGVSLDFVGTPIFDPVRIILPKPMRTSEGWEAHTTVEDIFGNITLDLRADQLDDRTDVIFIIAGQEVSGLVESYGWKKPGELVAVVDSEGYIEIAVVNGSAAKSLNAQVGDPIRVILPKQQL